MKLQKYELQEDFMGMKKGEFFTIAGVYNDKGKLVIKRKYCKKSDYWKNK